MAAAQRWPQRSSHRSRAGRICGLQRSKCDSDGEWRLSAQLTDPSGLPADPYEAEFIVDATKPSLTLTLDNNRSKNGNYYNANRTATVTVSDRNLDMGSTHIAVTAK